MSNKKQNEELQSRREFFKKAAKAALPVVGVILVSSMPMLAKASESGCFCQGCTGGCSSGCYSSCYGGCMYNCGGDCKGSCRGTCVGSCHGTCEGSCHYSCSGISY